jgi:hypothetical protein
MFSSHIIPVKICGFELFLVIRAYGQHLENQKGEANHKKRNNKQ